MNDLEKELYSALKDLTAFCERNDMFSAGSPDAIISDRARWAMASAEKQARVKSRAKKLSPPPPWFVGMRTGHNANTIYARDGKDAHHDTAICLVFGISQHRTAEEARKDEGFANALLLAAAPELKRELAQLVASVEISEEVNKHTVAYLASAQALLQRLNER